MHWSVPKYIYAASLALLANEVEVYLKTSIKFWEIVLHVKRVAHTFSASVRLAAGLMHGMYSL